MRGQEELPRTTDTGRQESTTMNNEQHELGFMATIIMPPISTTERPALPKRLTPRATRPELDARTPAQIRALQDDADKENKEDVLVATPKADLDKATTYTDEQIETIKAQPQLDLERTRTSFPKSFGRIFFGESPNEIGRGLYHTSQASPTNGVSSSEETTDCNHSSPPELKR